MAKKSSFIFFLCAIIAFFLYSFLVSGLAAKDNGGKAEYILKWGTIAPTGTAWHESVERVNRIVEKETNGQVKNVWYYGAVMGDEVDMIRKVKLGQLQGMALLTVGLQKISPETGAFTLPFLFRNFDEVDCVFPKVWGLVEESFEKHGFVVLGYTDVCFAILQSRITPEEEKNLFKGISGSRIESWEKAAELAGFLKQWAWIGLDIDQRFYQVMGIENVIPLPLTDVMTSLQTGMINSVYGSCTTTVALQWQIYINSIINFEGYKGVAYAPAMLVLDKKTYYSLPKEYREIIKNACQTELGPRADVLSNVLRMEEEKMCEGLRKRGAREFIFGSQIVERYRQKSLALRDDAKGKYYPPEFIRAVVKARDECRAENP